MADSPGGETARGEHPGIPDPLAVDGLQRLLSTRTLGRNLRVEARTASTNDIAKQLALDGAPDGTVVIADEQHQGRGRQGRSFASPAGVGIYMSLLLRPRVAVSRLPQLTLVAGVAAAEAVEDIASVPVALKWPNDIMVRGKKAGGILTESVLQADRPPVAVVGIGINVNTTLEQFPERHCASGSPPWRLAAGRFVPRLPTIAAVLGHFEPLYDTFQQSGLAPILPTLAALRPGCRQTGSLQHGTRRRRGQSHWAWTRTAPCWFEPPTTHDFRILSGDVVFP